MPIITFPFAILPAQMLFMLRFFARVPIPAALGRWAHEEAGGLSDFGAALPGLPLAGSIIGACAAVCFWASLALFHSAPIAVVIAPLALALITGALHEDGLADCVDGFFGGYTSEQRLAIMKDSRIGAYGALALVFSVTLRIAALARVFEAEGAWRTGLVLILAAALSRALALVPLVLLESARTTGLAAGIGMLPHSGLRQMAWVMGALMALALALGVRLEPLLQAAMAAGAVAYGVARLSQDKIGGATGDVAGACQQLTELALYLGFCG